MQYEPFREMALIEGGIGVKLFLTSFSGGFGKVNGQRVPCEFNRANGFFDLLKEKLPPVIRCLMIASDPLGYERNDEVASNLKGGFALDGFKAERVDICDNRSMALVERLHEYNLVFLTGGHVPTQNKFFNKINLKLHLQNYDGVIIGMSAGSMNCADIVYAQPEDEGEAINPGYDRYLNGLCLTSINVLPHFEILRDSTLDGLRVLEDICLPDSIARPFYGIPDGTFIYIEDGQTTLFGEAFYFEGGNFTKICENGCSLKIA